MNAAYPGDFGIQHVVVPVYEMREIVHQTVNQAHVIVGIHAGELYPLAAENHVIREADSKEQGYTEE